MAIRAGMPKMVPDEIVQQQVAKLNAECIFAPSQLGELTKAELQPILSLGAIKAIAHLLKQPAPEPRKKRKGKTIVREDGSVVVVKRKKKKKKKRSLPSSNG